MRVIWLTYVAKVYVQTRNIRARVLVGMFDCATKRWGVYTTAHVPRGCVCSDSLDSPYPHVITIR